MPHREGYSMSGPPFYNIVIRNRRRCCGRQSYCPNQKFKPPSSKPRTLTTKLLRWQVCEVYEDITNKLIFTFSVYYTCKFCSTWDCNWCAFLSSIYEASFSFLSMASCCSLLIFARYSITSCASVWSLCFKVMYRIMSSDLSMFSSSWEVVWRTISLEISLLKLTGYNSDHNHFSLTDHILPARSERAWKKFPLNGTTHVNIEQEGLCPTMDRWNK